MFTGMYYMCVCVCVCVCVVCAVRPAVHGASLHRWNGSNSECPDLICVVHTKSECERLLYETSIEGFYDYHTLCHPPPLRRLPRPSPCQSCSPRSPPSPPVPAAGVEGFPHWGSPYQEEAEEEGGQIPAPCSPPPSPTRSSSSSSSSSSSNSSSSSSCLPPLCLEASFPPGACQGAGLVSGGVCERVWFGKSGSRFYCFVV